MDGHSPVVWKENDSYLQTALILSLQCITFTVFSTCLAFVVWKLKANIMGRLSLMLAIFALIFLIRLVLDLLRIVYFDEDRHSLPITIMKICHETFTKLQWFGIYYFILEISDIKNKLQSSSVKEY